jgi:tetratricopeptide (TPR) repeat protein
MGVPRGQYDRTMLLEDGIPAWASHELGRLFAAQVKLTEAEAMYKRALAGREEALGAEHTDTLLTVNNLGVLYAAQGELAEAETMYNRALAGYEKALGAEHMDTLMTINNLGNVYKAQGRLAKAGVMYERALAGREKTLGVEHHSTLRTVNNLGALYSHQGRLAEAEAMYKRALAGYEEVLGAEHMDTLAAVSSLGTLYRERHDLHISSINRRKTDCSFFVSRNDSSLVYILSVCHLWTKWRQARTQLVKHLGHMLLSLGRLQDAVVALEQHTVRSHGGGLHSGLVCDGCDDSIRLPSIHHVCASCNDVKLCPTCHHQYELEGRLDLNVPTCQNHVFLAVPRDIWSRLPSGAVLSDGTTAEEWMNRVMVSLIEDDDRMQRGGIRRQE